MVKNNWLTKVLAIAGTVLLILPVLAPIVFSILRLIESGRFNVDYLMPAEMGLAVIIGAGFLLWAAIRVRSRVKWIAWWIGIAIVLVVGSQVLAMVTGLASGEIEPSGYPYVIVLGGIIGYDLAVVALGVSGVLLCLDVFRKK